jgi:hypothetical protein
MSCNEIFKTLKSDENVRLYLQTEQDMTLFIYISTVNISPNQPLQQPMKEPLAKHKQS